MNLAATHAASFFNPTIQHFLLHSIHHDSSSSTRYSVAIYPRIDRGFFLDEEGNWTCYRRNYFQVTLAFDLIDTMTGEGFISTNTTNGHPILLAKNLPSSSTVSAEGNSTKSENVLCKPTTAGFLITGFLIGVSAKSVDDDKPVEITQHTAKRDKGPILTPERMPIVCSSRGSFNARGSSSTSSHPHLLGAGGRNGGAIVTFPRLQFKTSGSHSATASITTATSTCSTTSPSTLKRKSPDQRKYKLLVELFAQTTDGQVVKIAERESMNLLVRGRSPGQYQHYNGMQQQALQKQQQHHHQQRQYSLPNHQAFLTTSNNAPTTATATVAAAALGHSLPHQLTLSATYPPSLTTLDQCRLTQQQEQQQNPFKFFSHHPSDSADSSFSSNSLYNSSINHDIRNGEFVAASAVTTPEEMFEVVTPSILKQFISITTSSTNIEEEVEEEEGQGQDRPPSPSQAFKYELAHGILSPPPALASGVDFLFSPLLNKSGPFSATLPTPTSSTSASSALSSTTTTHFSFTPISSATELLDILNE